MKLGGCRIWGMGVPCLGFSGSSCGRVGDGGVVVVGGWQDLDFAGVTAEGVRKLCDCGHLAQAVEAVGVLVRTERGVSRSVLYDVLKGCVGRRDLVLGRRVHGMMVRLGYESDAFLGNHMLRMYAGHGRLGEVMDVFEGVARKDAFMWSSVISAHVKRGEDREAVQLYRRMRRSGVVPDGHVFVAALQACARGADLETGEQVHAHVLAAGIEPDLFVCNALVDMYAKCGSLEDARRVFDGLGGRRDVVTWTALIAGYSQKGMGEEALRLYFGMEEEGIAVPNSVTFVCLLQACAAVGAPALETGKRLHAQIRDRGHQADVFVSNSLVNMYAKCDSLEDAQRVFDGLATKDVVTWNAMIAGYTQRGLGQDALLLYASMQEEGIAVPNSVTFGCLLHACSSVGTPCLEMGKQLHVQIRDRGFQDDAALATNLVNMYAKCGSLEDAQMLFDRLREKEVVTWNAMIAGYSQQGMGQEALRLYSAMQEGGSTVPDSVTFACLLQACAVLGAQALEEGKQLHAQIRERGHEADAFVSSSLVNMYAKCCSLKDAQRVFDALGRQDVVTWNALIAGCSQQGMGQEAFHLYRKMSSEGIASPNSVTFVSLLQACASLGSPALEKGKQLHAQIREHGLQADVFVANSLVNMYAKCGSLGDAQRLFDGLGQKNVVTWNAMIAGYSKQGMGQEALSLYNAMHEQGMAAPDAVTFVCLLQACANVAALHLGRQLHARIKEQGLEVDVFLGGSLINMYGKSGSMVDAQQVFDALSQRDDVTWSALIAGYASQGDSQVVFNLFQRMTEDGIQPVGITFVSVLTACSHAGLVSKGREYFGAMSRQYSITPSVEHYTCMVDLLGRAGLLEEAVTLIETMSVLPNAGVWHTLLNASRKWCNLEVGRHAFNEAMKLDKKDASAYTLMSNIYKGSQMWEQAQEMQAARIRTRAWKQLPGQSWWTDRDGQVHSFLAGYKRCPRISRMKQDGYVLHVDSPPADICESKKQGDLCWHNEKLAMASALNSTTHVMTYKYSIATRLNSTASMVK